MSLFGPVFHKELLELSRRRTTYLLRVVAGLGLLFVVFFFANEGGISAFLSTARRQAAIAARVFENWAWYQFWIICGVMPLLTCGLVAAERETGSLPLLFTTHLTNREIILGKLASRLLTVFLLSFSALPVLVLLGLLGGIDLDRLFKIYLMTSAAAALAASIGVYLSTTAKRPWVACIQTYALLGVVWGCTPWVILFGYMLYVQSTGAALGGPPNREFMQVLMFTGPYLPIYFLTEHQLSVLFAGMLDWERVLTLSATWLGVGAVFLFLAMRALRKDLNASLFSRAVVGVVGFFLRPLKSASPKRLRIESALFWRLRFSGFAIFEGNAIVWRDRRADVYDPDGNILRLQVLLWIVVAPMGLLFAAMGRGGRGLFAWLLAIEIAFFHLMLAVVGASSLARERQRGSLDVMLLSKMPSWSIVVGTIQGVFWTCTPTLILIAGSVALKSWTEWYDDATFEMGFLALVLCYSAVIVVGSVVVSTAASKPNHAIVAAVVIGLLHWFWPLPISGVWALLQPSEIHHGAFLAFVWLFTLLLFGSLIVGARLLATNRAFPASVAFVAAIPALVLFVAPIQHGTFDATSLLRWIVVFKWGSWSSPAFRSSETEHVAFITMAAYLVAVGLFLVLVRWNADRLLGRMQARQPPRTNPPLSGRSNPATGSPTAMPTNAPS